MKIERLNYALIAGAFASVVALIAGVRSGLQLDSVIGYGAFLALVAVAALEYRLGRKSLVGK